MRKNENIGAYITTTIFELIFIKHTGTGMAVVLKAYFPVVSLCNTSTSIITLDQPQACEAICRQKLKEGRVCVSWHLIVQHKHRTSGFFHFQTFVGTCSAKEKYYFQQQDMLSNIENLLLQISFNLCKHHFNIHTCSN